MGAIGVIWNIATPLPNLLIMQGIGESKKYEEPIAMAALFDYAVKFIESAAKFKGLAVRSENDESNFPDAEKGKVKMQINLLFPDSQSLKNFLKENSP